MVEQPSHQHLVPLYGDRRHFGDVIPTPYDNECLGHLERCVVEQRSAKLQREALRLARQRAFLREERRNARMEEAAILSEEDQLKHVVGRNDWWPSNYLPGAGDPSSRLRLRVGGQKFEIATSMLERDPGSLLFALAAKDSPLQILADTDKDDDNFASSTTVAVVDRDWWLFRFIMVFLRDGIVPADRSTALQLYREAAFWRLGTLQRAIEEAVGHDKKLANRIKRSLRHGNTHRSYFIRLQS